MDPSNSNHARHVINRMNLAAARRGDLVIWHQRVSPRDERLPLAERGNLTVMEQPRTILEQPRPEEENHRSTCQITVVVPTRNEQANVSPLVERLTAALRGRSARVLFVDDSDDDTPSEVLRVAATSGLPVELLHRTGAERTGGLGGAVLAGLRRAGSRWVVVMDGDLQHPPELVPRLVDAGEQQGVDVVVASRHIPGGATTGLSSVSRVLVSGLSITLSKVAFPKRLKGVSDPMSGFFALRPESFDLDVLHPEGFKILLELLARSDGVKKSEVPFVFGARNAGESKASLKEGLIFGVQLLRLRLARLVSGHSGPQSQREGGRGWLPDRGMLRRGAGFAAVGFTGLFVNLLVTWLLVDRTTLGINYLIGAAIATQISSTWNFALVDNLVYSGEKRLTALRRWLGFMAMSNLVLLLRIPLLAVLVSTLHVHYLVATLLTLFLGYAVRFQSQERLTLTEKIS